MTPLEETGNVAQGAAASGTGAAGPPTPALGGAGALESFELPWGLAGSWAVEPRLCPWLWLWAASGGGTELGVLGDSEPRRRRPEPNPAAWG